MNINNNFNNNQINFRADLKCLNGVEEELTAKLAKIAQEAKETDGDVVVVSQGLCHSRAITGLSSFITQFDYFKKGNIFAGDTKKFAIRLSSSHPEINPNAAKKENMIIEFFQELMNQKSKS